MPELFPIGIDEQISAVQRELGYRGHVYRRRVGSGQMTQNKADREIAAMEAVLATLQKVRALDLAALRAVVANVTGQGEPP